MPKAKTVGIFLGAVLALDVAVAFLPAVALGNSTLLPFFMGRWQTAGSAPPDAPANAPSPTRQLKTRPRPIRPRRARLQQPPKRLAGWTMPL